MRVAHGASGDGAAMTRAQRHAKAAAWERMAERAANPRVQKWTPAQTRSAPVTEGDTLLVVEERCAVGCFGPLSGYTRELAVLHCLSEAARLRSGVPV